MAEIKNKIRQTPSRAGYAWLALVLLLFTPASALAHKVNLFAYQEGGRVKGEAYFSGGDKARASLVEMLDPQGNLLATTHTDQEGNFSLPLPGGKGGPYRLLLKAGQGHQGEYTLEAGEAKPADSPPGQGSTPQPGGSRQSEARAQASPPGQAELEGRMLRLLDQRLQPLTAQVAKLSGDRGVTLHDIIGGLGYILGLMGLAAYLKARRKG